MPSPASALALVIASCQERHRSREFIQFLNHLEAQLPAHQDVHLIMDNDCTHKGPEVERWLKRTDPPQGNTFGAITSPYTTTAVGTGPSADASSCRGSCSNPRLTGQRWATMWIAKTDSGCLFDPIRPGGERQSARLILFSMSGVPHGWPQACG